MSSNAVILEKNLNLCDGLTRDYRFWVAVCCSALVEPVLCANYHEFGMYTAQAIVLFVSVALFVVQILGEVARRRELLSLGMYGFVMYFLGRGEYILEFVCLVAGVSFLYTYPGIAALRCFRVLRLLWLSDNAGFRANVIQRLSPYLGKEFVDRCFRVFRFAIRSLSALGNEMFRLTEKTRGGLFLMLVLFYMAFVFGIVLWIETGNPDNECNALGPCMYTMLRITFFDGTGLDYAYSLVGSHSFLFVLVMCYMSVSAFGVINGMIGIFATVFASASEEAFVQGWPEDEAPAETGEMPDGKGKMGSVHTLSARLPSSSSVLPSQMEEAEGGGQPSSSSLREAQVTNNFPNSPSSCSPSPLDDAPTPVQRPQSVRRLFSLVPQASYHSLPANVTGRKSSKLSLELTSSRVASRLNVPRESDADATSNVNVHDVCASLQDEVAALREDVRQLMQVVQDQHKQWQEVAPLLRNIVHSAQFSGLNG